MLSRILRPDLRLLVSKPGLLGLLALVIGLLGFHSAASGAAACGISVSTTGLDSPTCGLAPGSACRTVQKGIDRAVVEGVPCVFVQAGVYTETISLRSGIAINGGFDATWQLGPRTDPAHETRIVGVANQVENQAMTVVLRNLLTAPVLRNLVLVGAPAQGLEGINGKSSYVVHAISSNLVLRDVTVLGAAGAGGSTGTSGTDASNIARTLARNGGTGGNGDRFLTSCDDASRGAGGPAGTNPCAGSAVATGGVGGSGGTMDTHCEAFNNDFTARAGSTGGNAGRVVALFGTGGNGGALCASGNSGLVGHLQNGSSGTASSPALILSSGFPTMAAAGAGQGGGTGGGGGGGGGEGGCDTGTDEYGAGGGGGGAGGCAAPSGGGPGGNGGGTYAFALIASHLDIQDCVVTRGTGGKGGSGGTGGRGQQGGLGGPGGTGPTGRLAGIGGAGAHGGHGGGGAGGTGGASVAYLTCGGVVANNAGVVVSGGGAGAGGAGGISAPAAPVAEDDGNDGATGTSGTLGSTVVASQTGGACGTIPPNAVIPACDITTCGTIDVGPGAATFTLSFAGLSPNPTGAGGRMQFVLPQAGPVRLTLFDSAGRLVRVLASTRFDAGRNAVIWDGRGLSGRTLASGLYYARLEFEGQERTQRVVVIR